LKVVLFGGGIAGETAVRKLGQDRLAGIVWDDDTGKRPKLLGVPFFSEESCQGQGETLFCSGYGKVLKKSLIDAFPRGAFNAHPSLLPDYRGRHAIQWAIAGGEKELGVTIHRLTAEVDQGDFFLVRKRRFGINEKCAAIALELAEMAADMLIELYHLVEKQQLPEPLPPQSPRSRYFRQRRPEDGKLVWEENAVATVNKIRASMDKYRAYAYLADGSKVSFHNYLAGDLPGEVLLSTSEGCLIAAGDGVVWLVPDRPLSKGDILK
jgi:methionyl-tRNA formyltransferase